MQHLSVRNRILCISFLNLLTLFVGTRTFAQPAVTAESLREAVASVQEGDVSLQIFRGRLVNGSTCTNAIPGLDLEFSWECTEDLQRCIARDADQTILFDQIIVTRGPRIYSMEVLTAVGDGWDNPIGVTEQERVAGEEVCAGLDTLLNDSAVFQQSPHWIWEYDVGEDSPPPVKAVCPGDGHELLDLGGDWSCSDGSCGPAYPGGNVQTQVWYRPNEDGQMRLTLYMLYGAGYLDEADFVPADLAAAPPNCE